MTLHRKRTCLTESRENCWLGRVLEEGWTLTAAAEAADVSDRTAGSVAPTIAQMATEPSGSPRDPAVGA